MSTCIANFLITAQNAACQSNNNPLSRGVAQNMRFTRQTNYAVLICVITLLSTSAFARNGDIYISEGTDGTPRFSSQPYDESYRLYLKGDSPPAFVKGTIAHSARSRYNRIEIDSLIRISASKHGLDPDLIRAVVEVESAYNPLALSPKGAIGPMQLIPATAARYGIINPGDPQQNIDGGVRYLKDLIANHNGNVALALAAYNSGERAVLRHGCRIPPFQETMIYVPNVLARYEANKHATGSSQE